MTFIYGLSSLPSELESAFKKIKMHGFDFYEQVLDVR